MKSIESVRSEFDEIADLSSQLPDKLGPHEAAILRAVPDGCGSALDIGCGAGAVARRLAARCGQVVGIDISPRMIANARSRSAGYPNIEYHVAEAGEWLNDTRSYDCITSMAVLHHMEIEPTIRSIVRSLRLGGRLLVVDILDRPGWRNKPLNVVTFILTSLRILIVRRRLPSRALHRAWEHHGRGETYLTIDQARAIFEPLLPGCVVRQHFFWRYSVTWTKSRSHGPFRVTSTNAA
jgi:ubiquinone/menaquinone biosynthesis C-methylase UbiE